MARPKKTEAKATTPKRQTRKKTVAAETVQAVSELIGEEEGVTVLETAEPYLFEGKQMYWARPMFFMEFGKVEGLIYTDHWATFKKHAPDDIDITKWISSVDKKAERQKEAKERFKRQLGIVD